MIVDSNVYVAAWYAILTFLFIWYTVFNLMQFRRFGDVGAQYVAIIFGSLSIGMFCIAIVRLYGTAGTQQDIWLYIQRGSYVGVLLGGWWLIDYRLALRNGEGIPLRALWRFWYLFRKQEGRSDEG